jgi:replicative DNA helicase
VLVELWNAAQAIDLITVTQTLRDRHLLESVGGPAFVTTLFTFVPTAANVQYYIDIVREKRALREVQAAARECLQARTSIDVRRCRNTVVCGDTVCGNRTQQQKRQR